MEKRLKDFIHYYIGQTYQIQYIETPGSWTVPVSLTALRIAKLDDKSISGIHLYLRRLSSMTEEEALEVCKISNPGEFGDFRYSKWKAILDPKSNKDWKVYEVTNERSDFSWVIDLIDGDVAAYDEKGMENVPTNNQHAITHYLLSQGFDLWNLIDSGLAIDKDL